MKDVSLEGQKLLEIWLWTSPLQKQKWMWKDIKTYMNTPEVDCVLYNLQKHIKENLTSNFKSLLVWLQAAVRGEMAS